MPVTQAFRDVAYPQEAESAIGYLLVIEHDGWDASLRLTDIMGTWSEAEAEQAYVLDVGGERYFWAPFQVIEPNQDDKHPVGKLVVLNVNRLIGEAVEAANGAMIATLTPVLKSAPTVPIADPWALMEVTNIRGDSMQVEGDISWPKLSTKPFPHDWIRPEKFRAAFRALT